MTHLNLVLQWAHIKRKIEIRSVDGDNGACFFTNSQVPP